MDPGSSVPAWPQPLWTNRALRGALPYGGRHNASRGAFQVAAGGTFAPNCVEPGVATMHGFIGLRAREQP
jgi:hypothetical protein